MSGALALAALPLTEASAQFTVWKDGVSVYALEDGRADYVTFDYTPVGSLADAEPDPSVGGAVSAKSAAVDLGLTSGTLWTPWNVGATKPGEAGAYFAWGETTAKESYDWSTYKHMKEGESDWKHINKYTTEDGQTAADWYARTFIGDGKTTLDESDDAAAGFPASTTLARTATTGLPGSTLATPATPAASPSTRAAGMRTTTTDTLVSLFARSALPQNSERRNKGASRLFR